MSTSRVDLTDAVDRELTHLARIMRLAERMREVDNDFLGLCERISKSRPDIVNTEILESILKRYANLRDELVELFHDHIDNNYRRLL